MGQFVNKLPVKPIAIGDPWSAISDRIDEVQGYADQWAQVLAETIEELGAGVGQYHPNFPSLSPNIPSLSSPSYPAKPDLTVHLNENWPSTSIPEPIIKDADADFSFVDPVAPDGVDPEFPYTPGVYESCVLSTLCDKIKDSLINGGTGLNDLVYGLIVERDREARRVAEERTRQRAFDSVGARGFDLPGGMVAAVLLELDKEILAKDIDAVNQTTIKDFDLADANTKFSKELALKFEGVARSSYDSDENRLFEIAKVSKELIISTYEQNVKLYLAKWEGVKSKLDAAKTRVEAIISENEGQIKVFTGRADVLKSKIMAISEENRAKTDAVKSKAAVYEAEVRAISTQFQAMVEEVRIALDRYKTEVQAAVSIEDINLRAFTSAADLSAQISTSIANIAAQSVASALGAINTSMSFGYSGATSARISQGITNSLSEGHSYEDV